MGSGRHRKGGWGFDKGALACVKLECCNCNRNNFKTEEECLQRCTHVNDETTSDYLSHEEKEEEGEEEARPDQGKQFKGKKRAKPQKDILPRSLTAYHW